MYSFYIDGVLLPVAPDSVSIKQGGSNKTYNLLDGGEVNVLKSNKLQEIEFTALLPNSKYPFADTSEGYHDADYYLGKIKKMKNKKSGFRLVITRKRPSGALLWGTSLKVSLEDYSTNEDAEKYGFDVGVKLKFKEYKSYGSKIVEVEVEEEPVVVEERPADNPPTPVENKTYTVKSGDTLWKIAKQFYGDGSQYPKIASANGIANPNLIYPNQVFVIPA